MRVKPFTPPALESVMKKCLAKDSDERWQSASDLASELKWIGESGADGAAREVADETREIPLGAGMGSDHAGRYRGDHGGDVLRDTAYTGTAIDGFGNSSAGSVCGYLWKNWTAADISRWEEDCVYRLQDGICCSVDAGRQDLLDLAASAGLSGGP